MGKVVFVLGKGGAGKTTVASLCALRLAGEGNPVVLASLDPAHNLGDLFGLAVADKPVRVERSLLLLEVDQKKWLKRYLDEKEQQMRNAYRYLSSFSMEEHFSVVRHSPGMEEHAMLLAFEALQQEYGENNTLILDMPPTGLALSFLSLPAVSVLWLQKLAALRAEIVKKKEVADRLLGNKEHHGDRVSAVLQQQLDFYGRLNRLFRDSKNTVMLVIDNPELLAQKEAERIATRLQELDMPEALRLTNKSNRQKENELLYVQNTQGLANLKTLLQKLPQNVLEKLR